MPGFICFVKCFSNNFVLYKLATIVQSYLNWVSVFLSIYLYVSNFDQQLIAIKPHFTLLIEFSLPENIIYLVGK